MENQVSSVTTKDITVSNPGDFYPVFRSPDGMVYQCIAFGINIEICLWEWFAFEETTTDDDVLYFGYVDGDVGELGQFSRNELLHNNIDIFTDPRMLEDLLPPEGWIHLGFAPKGLQRTRENLQ